MNEPVRIMSYVRVVRANGISNKMVCIILPICTLCYRPPSLIYHLSRHRGTNVYVA